MMIKTIRDKSDNRNFQVLIHLLDNELNLRYDIIQQQYDALNKIGSIDTVVIGYIDNNPVGCGCFKDVGNNSIEIKRMFVKPESRGSGIAKLILTELENWAIEKGFSKSVLETGIKQPDAIRFYTKLGYTRIENYGPYKDNKNSICMSKELLKIRTT